MTTLKTNIQLEILIILHILEIWSYFRYIISNILLAESFSFKFRHCGHPSLCKPKLLRAQQMKMYIITAIKQFTHLNYFPSCIQWLYYRNKNLQLTLVAGIFFSFPPLSPPQGLPRPSSLLSASFNTEFKALSSIIF